MGSWYGSNATGSANDPYGYKQRANEIYAKEKSGQNLTASDLKDRAKLEQSNLPEVRNILKGYGN